jgi:hypothetical protein
MWDTLHICLLFLPIISPIPITTAPMLASNTRTTPIPDTTPVHVDMVRVVALMQNIFMLSAVGVIAVAMCIFIIIRFTYLAKYWNDDPFGNRNHFVEIADVTEVIPVETAPVETAPVETAPVETAPRMESIPEHGRG